MVLRLVGCDEPALLPNGSVGTAPIQFPILRPHLIVLQRARLARADEEPRAAAVPVAASSAFRRAKAGQLAVLGLFCFKSPPFCGCRHVSLASATSVNTVAKNTQFC
jgi:hypothetical protein